MFSTHVFGTVKLVLIQQRRFTRARLCSDSEAGQTGAENRRASRQNVRGGQTALHIKGSGRLDVSSHCVTYSTVELLVCVLRTGGG